MSENKRKVESDFKDKKHVKPVVIKKINKKPLAKKACCRNASQNPDTGGPNGGYARTKKNK